MRWALLPLILLAALAQAATLTVSWTNPTTNTDGTPVATLDHVTIFWARCATLSPPTLSTTGEGAIDVPVADSGGYALTTSTPSPICLFLTVTDVNGGTSPPSATVIWSGIPSLGAPTTLGQPILIH